MNRTDFKRLSGLRLREAKVLLRSGLYHGSYYLAGYAVECAIKACICKRTKRFDFPDKELAKEAWVHDLGKLIAVAELSGDLEHACKSNRGLEVNWATVKDWSEAKRYDTTVSGQTADAFYLACTRKADGVLPWVRARW